MAGISHLSAITIYGKIRRRIAEECERRTPFKGGEVEADESYFGPQRVRCRRGCGASRKVIFFRVLNRDGKVYTEVVTACKKATLQAVIRDHATPQAVIHLDARRGYYGLVGYLKRY